MNEKHTTQHGRLCLILVLVPILLLASCSGTQEAVNAPDSGRTHEITPSLREFYNTLGGESLFGPAISEDFAFQEFECQYTVNALLCLNPSATGDNRFGLYSLGNALEISEDPGTSPPDENARVVNGYGIYEEFIPMFDHLSGVQYAGNPISPVHINYSQGRVEQFFENVGLYRSFDDPAGTVKLLAYGVMACDERCNYSASLNALILSSDNAAGNQPFLPQMGKLGGATAFGEPLTQPYIAEDDAQEQVYANAVLFSPAGNPSQVLLRPLPLLLGIPRSEPGAQRYGNRDGVVFYPVKDELGYHVPLVFDAFIAAHGGMQLSGEPISETLAQEENVYRQCFENYCLDYRPSAPQNQQVSLAPLGQQYLELLQKRQGENKPLTISPETVAILLTEQFKKLAPASPQRIEILVFSKADQKPLAGIESELELTLPDGKLYTAGIEATQNDGKASVIIPPMKDIANGSILSYRVCLKAATSQPVCASSNYVIWNSP